MNKNLVLVLKIRIFAVLPFPETDSELDVSPVVVPVAGAVSPVASLAGQEPEEERFEKMFGS